MTEEELLSMFLKHARDQADVDLQKLQEQADLVLENLRAGEEALFARYGKKRCPKCNGTGAIQRLDAGYMRRFGLREWNGCSNCGSTDQEERGRGYVDI